MCCWINDKKQTTIEPLYNILRALKKLATDFEITEYRKNAL